MTSEDTYGAPERLEELLVADWGGDLMPEERAELDALAARSPGATFELERAAGAACVAFAAADALPVPPAELMAAVRQQATAHFAGPQLRVVEGGSEPKPVVRASKPTWGWPLAVAAALALAVAGWLPRLGPPPAPPEPQIVRVEVPPPAPPPPNERATELKTAATDAQSLAWSTTKDPWVADGVEGEVVWSNDRQEGYMRFRGLPKNDPSEHRYQLWIFDGSRDDRFPVDGGVFDIAQIGGETVVPIAAKLPVRKPALFAVTLEGPDGVVVSSREHILVVAQVD